MRVTLDQDHWEVAGDLTLGEVLADMSEKAHARARLITSLLVDRRVITDRDLDPAFLAEAAARYAAVQASSRAIDEVLHGAGGPLRRYAGLLREESLALAACFRQGDESFTRLDTWCGQFADYVECLESAPVPSGPDRSLVSWARELLQARADRDLVRLADLLEYEIGSRLAS